MTPADLEQAIQDAATSLLSERTGSTLEQPRTPRINGLRLVRPRQSTHGDWASNVALQLAPLIQLPAPEVAARIAAVLSHAPGIASADVAGPGFINITLEAAAAAERTRAIVMAAIGRANGQGARQDRLGGPAASLDSSPTTVRTITLGVLDPRAAIDLAAGRRAVMQDSVARLVAATGTTVIRECLLRDPGAVECEKPPCDAELRALGIHVDRYRDLRESASAAMDFASVRTLTRPALRSGEQGLSGLAAIVGIDATRYVLCASPAGEPLELDLEILTRRSPANPVYRVQYAHALMARLARNAESIGIRALDSFDPALLTHSSESTLLGTLAEFDRVITRAATRGEPHTVASYLDELARHTLHWYDSCRVLPRTTLAEEVSVMHHTRLRLAHATRITLASGLELLDVSAPERM